MKKLSLFLAVATAVGIVSCTAQAPKPTLKSDIDSLSYATGMARTEGLMPYLTQQVGMDTVYMADFMKGLIEGAQSTSAKDVAYLAGLQIGQMVGKNWVEGINRQIFGSDSTMSINKSDMLAGFVAGVKNDTTKMHMGFAQTYSQDALQKVAERIIEEKYADNKAAGEKFLAENKDKDGVITTESGLQYEILVAGKGEMPESTSRVKVKYTGTLLDGTEFDTSGNDERTFRANQVIKGWTEALTMMPVGSKWKLYIPQDLAYGARESGKISPFSALIFEVELTGIEKD